MQPGFVGFQNFAQGFHFANREAIFRPGSLKETLERTSPGLRQRWDIVEFFPGHCRVTDHIFT